MATLTEIREKLSDLNKGDTIARLREIARDRTHLNIEMGALLTNCKKYAWYEDNFYSWVKSEFGIDASEAQALMRGYDAVECAGLTDADLTGVTPSAFSIIAPLLKKNPESFEMSRKELNDKLLQLARTETCSDLRRQSRLALGLIRVHKEEPPTMEDVLDKLHKWIGFQLDHVRDVPNINKFGKAVGVLAESFRLKVVMEVSDSWGTSQSGTVDFRIPEANLTATAEEVVPETTEDPGSNELEYEDEQEDYAPVVKPVAQLRLPANIESDELEDEDTDEMTDLVDEMAGAEGGV